MTCDLNHRLAVLAIGCFLFELANRCFLNQSMVQVTPLSASGVSDLRGNCLGGSIESRRSAVCRTQEVRPKPCQGKAGKKGMERIASESRGEFGWTENG